MPRTDDCITADDRPADLVATRAVEPSAAAESPTFDRVTCDHLVVKQIHVTTDGGMRINLPWGYVLFHNNEVTVASTVGDPPKLRFASVRGAGLGAISWNVLEDGQQKEVALLQGKVDERFPNGLGGEFTLHVRDNDIHDPDRAMTRTILLNSDSPEIVGGGGSVGDPFAVAVTALYWELLGRAPEGNVIEDIWRPMAAKNGGLPWVRAALLEEFNKQKAT